MNISGISIPASTSISNTDISIAVLGKNLDTLKQAGQDMVQMMEQSVMPNLGQNIDLRV